MAGKDGKKGRKIGRQSKRPSQVRYVASNRTAKNKERNIKRALKLEHKHAEKHARRDSASHSPVTINA